MIKSRPLKLLKSWPGNKTAFVNDPSEWPWSLWMTAGVFHRYFGSRTRPLFNKMLSNSIYVPNMTNPIFLSVKLGWLHLLCKMQTTADFQEFLASPPFWTFGEKAVGRTHGLVSKSSTWIKLLVCVNWEYFSCVFGMLLSCRCLHLLQLSVKDSLLDQYLGSG